MNVTLALLADYANVSEEGKLNVLGIFDVINSTAFPAAHLGLHLVLRFEAGPAERGQVKQVQIKLLGPDGDVLASVDGEMPIPETGPKLKFSLNQILKFTGLPIPAPGDYSFEVLVNGEPKISAPFTARRTANEE